MNRTPRIKTKDNKVRLIRPPWAGINSGFTLLFEDLILELATNMPIHKVSSLIHESDYKIWSLLEKYIEESLSKADHSNVNKVGIDETSKSKNHNYITLFVDLDEKRTIFITEGKEHETVEEFARAFEAHQGRPENISNVSCDMLPAFIKGIRENLPNAEITFDKFHIQKILNEAVDKVRKMEAKGNPLLKNTRFIFLKNRNNLTDKQMKILEDLSLAKLNLKTVRALQIRENFQSIYNAGSKDEFIILLRKWYFWATHSRLQPMIKAAKTIKNHWAGVIKWIESMLSNAILEGLNSVIQAVKARGRGFRTFRNFRIIACLVTGKLDFNLVNSYYVKS